MYCIYVYNNVYLYQQLTNQTKTREKENKKMRVLLYSVFNKETKKRIYTNVDRMKCKEQIEKLENKEKYIITYRYRSI